MIDKLTILKRVANDPNWPDLKGVLEEICAEIQNVTNIEDIEGMTGYKVSLGSLYLGKLIAAKKLTDIIHSVDVLIDKDTSSTEESFE